MTLLEQLERDEGFRQFPYADSVGVWTIGIGRNLESEGVSLEEGRYLAQNDINKRIAALRRDLPYFDGLSECRQGVLINMAFNLGMAGLFKFQKMLTAVGGGYYQQAAKEMLDSRWARQVGDRAKRLAEHMISDQRV
jgi:lysozyme